MNSSPVVEPTLHPAILWPALQYYYEQNLATLVDRLSGPVLAVYQDQYRLAEAEFKSPAPSDGAKREPSALAIFERYLSQLPLTIEELEVVLRARFESLGEIVSELTFAGHHLMSCLKVVPGVGEPYAPEPRSNVFQFLRALMTDLTTQFRVHSVWFDARVTPAIRAHNYDQCMELIARTIRLRVRAAGTTPFLACKWNWRPETLNAFAALSQYDAQSVPQAIALLSGTLRAHGPTSTHSQVAAPAIAQPTNSSTAPAVVIQDKIVQRYAAEQAQKLNELATCARQVGEQLSAMQQTLVDVNKQIQAQMKVGSAEHAQVRHLLETLIANQSQQLDMLSDIFQSNGQYIEQCQELVAQQNDMNREQVTQLVHTLGGVGESIQILRQMVSETSKTSASASAAAVSASVAAKSANQVVAQIPGLMNALQPPSQPAAATACATRPVVQAPVPSVQASVNVASAVPRRVTSPPLPKSRPPALVSSHSSNNGATKRSSHHLTYPAAPPSSRRSSIPSMGDAGTPHLHPSHQQGGTSSSLIVPHSLPNLPDSATNSPQPLEQDIFVAMQQEPPPLSPAPAPDQLDDGNPFEEQQHDDQHYGQLEEKQYASHEHNAEEEQQQLPEETDAAEM